MTPAPINLGELERLAREAAQPDCSEQWSDLGAGNGWTGYGTVGQLGRLVGTNPATILALTARLRAAEGAWQPIETAPHTTHMRQVLLFWPERGVCCGWFDSDEDYASRPASWRSPEFGWRSDGDQCIPINQPTHWRSLPAPPNTLSGEG